MTEAYTKAISEGRSHLQDLWQDRYIKYGPAGIEEVHCSGCQALIRKLIPHDQPVVRRVGNQTFVQERMVLACLPNYREVLLQMDDGNRHVTCVCVDCAPKLQDGSISLTGIYASDLSQWSAEGARLDDATCNRRPEAVLKVADIIKD